MDFAPSRRIRSHIQQAGTTFKDEYEIQSIPVFASLKRYPKRRRPAACTFVGFHDPEFVKDRYIAWSGKEATIQCRFYEVTMIRHIWLEIAGTSPEGSSIDLLVDDQTIVQNRRLRGRSTLRVSLPSVMPISGLDLKIVTNTFTPRQYDPQNEDTRTLGIALRGIAFAKRRYRYSPGMCFKKPLSQRVKGAWKSVLGRAA